MVLVIFSIFYFQKAFASEKIKRKTHPQTTYKIREAHVFQQWPSVVRCARNTLWLYSLYFEIMLCGWLCTLKCSSCIYSKIVIGHAFNVAAAQQFKMWMTCSRPFCFRLSSHILQPRLAVLIIHAIVYGCVCMCVFMCAGHIILF